MARKTVVVEIPTPTPTPPPTPPPTPVVTSTFIPPKQKVAVIQNITLGNIAFPEFKLGVNATTQVLLSQKIRDYAAEKFIKIIKII